MLSCAYPKKFHNKIEKTSNYSTILNIKLQDRICLVVLTQKEC